MWPTDAETLIAEQERLAAASPQPVGIDGDRSLITGVWVCFPRGISDSPDGAEHAWCAAHSTRAGTAVERRASEGTVDAPYVAGLIALRLGPLLDRLVRSLTERPDVLLVDATARDHPRRAGLAWQLGAVLNIPTIGVTHRPLVAGGDWPDEERGAMSPIRIDATTVGCWLRTQRGVRPLVVHPGWQVDLDTAVAVVMAVSRRRTPEPLRQARQLARSARARERPSMPTDTDRMAAG
ncbi:MAG TPA: endonuclease V [Microlunatus sp.]|nr:endonuclease V [Microlunatus sp.]